MSVKITDEMVSAILQSRGPSDEGEFPKLFDLLDFSGENAARLVAHAAVTAVAPLIAAAEREACAAIADDLNSDGSRYSPPSDYQQLVAKIGSEAAKAIATRIRARSS